MIEITYRWTSRLSMRVVKNGDIHVSAPIGTPRARVEQFINEHHDWIEKAKAHAHSRQEQREAFFAQLPLKTKTEIAQAKEQIDSLVAPMVAAHAEEMGVDVSSISYKRMISRWGMCNVRNKSICFSLYLLLLPEWCIEHVVVHELCHLLEPSHNARFHALMDRYYPRWREANRATRQIYMMRPNKE